MDDKKQPIIIKKIKKGGHGHHGGSWKVAFADFATAMMAFFMVMWLLQVSTPETLSGISQYFKEVTMIDGKAVVPSPGVQGPGGASSSAIDLGGGLNAIKEGKDEPDDKDDVTDKMKEELDEISKEKVEREKDRKRLDSLMSELQQAIENSQALAPYKDQLLLDITREGLRIQIIDKKNRPMFLSGSAQLKHYTEEILLEMATFINAVPNHISISGHTDATPFFGKNGYSNWELSADRANSARRTLVNGGLEDYKLSRVVGLASSVPFDRNAPESPINRRISIIVLNRETEQAIESNNAGEELNAMPASSVDTADDASDGVVKEINQSGDTEIPGPTSTDTPPTGGENDLNNLLRDLDTLNPQGSAGKTSKAPAATKPASAPPSSGNGKIQLAPVIDPSLLPRGQQPANK
jgi:chemotaxis protein MotB